ncbi:hypothetical protein MKZ38_005591 [Zalerion maritima]|uniref:Uncharacterized protein n=1 Tax=Zalerion maritima TaxID=339359 RepID=A0AAD5WQW8_9PEZI|nr:hypothetical protein MKZ38_005591 [Zalerion maritima]
MKFIPAFTQLPAASTGLSPLGLGGSILLAPPTTTFGMIKQGQAYPPPSENHDGGFGGACSDADGKCIHCGKTVNESAYKCKIESGGCGNVWNEKCSDVNCKCQAAAAGNYSGIVQLVSLSDRWSVRR